MNTTSIEAPAIRRPWRGLFTDYDSSMSIDQWARAAGLAHQVRKSVVEYRDDRGEVHLYGDRSVLFRDDTGAPLSVVGSDYNVVQPMQSVDYFRQFCEAGQVTMETGGCLRGGKSIFALARVHDGMPVISTDIIRPYLLFSTSYDGTSSTTVRFTTIRPHCWNGLQMAIKQGVAGGALLRITHDKEFSQVEADKALQIVRRSVDAFERFMLDARKLALKPVTESFATEFLRKILPVETETVTLKDGTKRVEKLPLESSKGYNRVMDLFRGAGLGADLPEARGTAWGLLNAVTEHVDHAPGGRPTQARLYYQMAGAGAELKAKAADLLIEAVS